MTGRLLRCRFQDLLSVHLRYSPAHSPSRHCDPFHRRLQPASSAPPPLRVLPGGANQFPSGTAPAEDQRLSRRTRIVGDRKLSQRLALPLPTVGGHLAGSSGKLKLSQKDFLSAEGQKNSSPIRHQEWAVSRCSEVRGMRRSKTSKGIRRGSTQGSAPHLTTVSLSDECVVLIVSWRERPAVPRCLPPGSCRAFRTRRQSS